MMNRSVPDFKKFLIITTLLVITGCASNVYNTPFIDTAETVQLKNNLSKTEVINSLGKPLYVENGTLKTSEISWIYEVRAREVQSDLLSTGEIIPNKDNDKKRPSQPIHYLRIIFVDGKVSKWEAFDKEEVAVEQKNTAKKYFFHPKVGFDIISYEYFEEEYYDMLYKNTSDKSLVLGAYLGWENPNYRYGLDAKLIGQLGILATIEKRNLFGNINLIAGTGAYIHSPKNKTVKETEYITDFGEWKYYSKVDTDNVITFAKIGISKDITLSGRPISIGMDLLANDTGIYPALSLAYRYK